MIASVAEYRMPCGFKMSRQPDRPAPKEDRIENNGNHNQQIDDVFEPIFRVAVQNALRPTIIVFNHTSPDPSHFCGIHIGKVSLLIMHMEDCERQRRQHHNYPLCIKLRPPAKPNNQPRDLQKDHYRADHGADPPKM